MVFRLDWQCFTKNFLLSLFAAEMVTAVLTSEEDKFQSLKVSDMNTLVDSL